MNEISQQKHFIWDTLLKIPMGQLSTYGNIAEQIGNPNASRAVGTAIGSNPVAFLIPCHRVIRSDGSLGGFSSSGGLALKKRLLELEQY